MKHDTIPRLPRGFGPQLWGWLHHFGTALKEMFIEFVWRDVRDGMIDLQGFGRPFRASVWLGFIITVFCLLLLTQSARLRAIFPLVTSTTPANGRGLHVPLLLFPLSAFIVSVAWAYLLAGAYHSSWALRASTLLLYSLTCAAWLTSTLTPAPRIAALGLALFGLTLCLQLLRQFRQNRPELHFVLTLVLVGAFFALLQYSLVRLDEASGLPIGRTILESNIRSLATVVMPLLVLVGLDIADFTVRASVWISKSATRLLPDVVVTLLAMGLLLNLMARVFNHIQQQINAANIWTIAAQFIGPAILILLLWFVWSLLEYAGGAHHTTSLGLDHLTLAAGGLALPVVLLFLLPLLTSFLLLEIALALQTLAVGLASGLFGGFEQFVTATAAFYQFATTFSTLTYSWQTQWQQALAIGMIVAAWVLARRDHRSGALYAVAVGIHYLWFELTRPGAWLEAFGTTSVLSLIFAWTLFAFSHLLLSLRRRASRPGQNIHLLLIMLLLTLMTLPELIAAPLDPFFALAGIGYLAVGLGWDLLSAGSWANEHTPTLPRISRIYLYLGYIILTVLLVNWAAAAHDLNMLERFTGQGAIMGLVLLGYPFLFVAIYLLSRGAPLSAEDTQSAPTNFGTHGESE